MKTVLIAAVVAALVALGVLYLQPKPSAPLDPQAMEQGLQQQLADLRAKIANRPVDLTLTLRLVDGECKSVTSPPGGYAYRNQRVRWTIVNVNCNTTGREVELRFAGDNMPLDVNRPRHGRFIQTKVRNNSAFGTYSYKIWLVGGGADVLLEDPELEIAEF